MKTLFVSIRMLLVLTVLTGAVYPLLVTGAARLIAPRAATGSLVKRGDAIVGSALLAQKTESPRYFWPRPSAVDFATVASGASNQGPTSAALVKAIGDRRARFGADAPAELLTASGSGLDPHISPRAAAYQAGRVAKERGIALEKVRGLIAAQTEGPQLGFLGEPRVTVLSLNLALAAMK
jgi:potassium-transporting ATPase KdpC subunit